MISLWVMPCHTRSENVKIKIALVRAIAFKRIQGGWKTFFKMQGGREGLSHNYVMREGGTIQKYKIGYGGVTR